jgi:hypothetical protein
MIRVGGQSQARIPRHFTQCSARFNETRSAAAVEKFVTAATIYKKVEGISDDDALKGLPLLLTGEAKPWWNGIKSNVRTWKEAMDLVRVPNYRLFQDIFETPQFATISTDVQETRRRMAAGCRVRITPEGHPSSSPPRRRCQLRRTPGKGACGGTERTRVPENPPGSSRSRKERWEKPRKPFDQV